MPGFMFGDEIFKWGTMGCLHLAIESHRSSTLVPYFGNLKQRMLTIAVAHYIAMQLANLATS